MGIKKFFVIGVILTIVFSIGFTTNIEAKNNDSNFGTFTKEQKNEIEKAKKRTEVIKKEWDKRTKKVYFKDKGDFTKDPASALLSTEDLSISSTYTGRSGVFYITLDGTSSSLSWAGGHAGIVYDTYNVVEAFGNQKDSALNGVHFWPNDWTTRYNHMEARTTYGTTLEEDRLAAVKAASYLGKPYNYNFFYINQDNSFYCSQLVWYSFYKLYGIDLNDGWAVWPVDLTESPKAYLIYSQ